MCYGRGTGQVESGGVPTITPPLSARMRTCSNRPVYSVLCTIRRINNGYFSLTVTHLHEDIYPTSCEKEIYIPLDLGELLDAMQAATAVLLSDQLKFSFETDDSGRPY